MISSMNHYSAFHTNGALAKVPVFAYLNAGLDADLRLDLMLLYTQALCNALASGKEYNEVQVQMIKTILRNKRFPAEMVRSVDQFMTQASLLSEDDLVCKTTRMLQGTAVDSHSRHVPRCVCERLSRIASIRNIAHCCRRGRRFGRSASHRINRRRQELPAKSWTASRRWACRMPSIIETYSNWQHLGSVWRSATSRNHWCCRDACISCDIH